MSSIALLHYTGITNWEVRANKEEVDALTTQTFRWVVEMNFNLNIFTI